MLTSSILTEMRNILADEKHWTKGANTRDCSGDWCPTLSPDGASFCVLGALNLASHRVNDVFPAPVGVYFAFRDRVMRTFPTFGGLVDWNDDPDTTYADIMRVLTEENEDGYR